MTTTAATQSATRTEIVRLLAVTVPARIVINTAYRMGYAFLPEFSRGLGVDLPTMSSLITLRGGAGLFAPVFGPLSDRFGRRTLMASGLALFVVCMLIAWWSSSLVLFAVGFVGLGLAKVIFDPSATAYLGDRVPYERRGLVMGINELGWSLAGFIGVPLMARAIETWGWQSPFALAALCGVFALAWTRMGLPNVAIKHPFARLDFRSAFAAIAQQRSAVVMLLVSACFLAAAEMVGVTYATWLERAFQVDVLTLGNIVATFAVADIVGEVLSMWSLDRFGKKRALLVGFIATTSVYFAMPWLGTSLTVAVAGLFVYYICFEFAVISIIPLITELVPEARATLLSLTSMAANIGRIVGALSGALLFTAYGFGAIGVVAGALLSVMVVTFAWGVREGGRLT